MYKIAGENSPVTAEQIFKHLQKRIIKLNLEPGQMISENQMAGEYGVSRSVIRTAFTRLEQIGFIDIYPQRGTYVSKIDLAFIRDLLLLRTAVEKEVLYEMFSSLNKTDRDALVRRLEENMERQVQCREEPDYFGNFPKLDSEFHRIMIDSVGRYSLVYMLKNLMRHLSRWRNFDVAFDHRIGQLIDEHRAIVEAIKCDDLAQAQDKMADHLETITAIADRAVAKYPNYFINY